MHLTNVFFVFLDYAEGEGESGGSFPSLFC
jgi:hypothetical protein